MLSLLYGPTLSSVHDYLGWSLCIRKHGEGNDHPLQCSCLENPMDRGAWCSYSLWGHKESDMTEWLQSLLENRDIIFSAKVHISQSYDFSNHHVWKREIDNKEGCEVTVAQSCLTLCESMDYSPLGFSVHGILQARILEWVAVPFSSGSSKPRDQTQVSCTAGGLFTIWATRKEGWVLKNWCFWIVALEKTLEIPLDWKPSNTLSRFVMGFPLWLSGKESACNVGEMRLIPALGRFPGGGYGNLLQYSCLESPMGWGAWRTTVHVVAKSWTWLKWLNTHTPTSLS